MRKSTVTVTGDAKQAIGILAWARDAGLQVATVTVGACRVEMVRQAGDAGPERADAPASTIYSQFGGPALASVVESEIPGNELQPVVGRG